MRSIVLAASVAALARAGSSRIHDVQGAAHISPMAGQEVSDVEGVITELAPGGFYMQDEIPDDDDATSEGIRVRSTASVSIGDVVLVTGLVREVRPGCAPCSQADDAYANLTTTELEASAIVAIGRAALPEAIPLGSRRGERRPPSEIVDDGVAGDVESEPAAFDAARHGIDFFESLEGMRVRIDDARAVGPTVRHFGRAAELAVVPSDGVGFGPLSSRGGLLRSSRDDNPERIIVTGAARLPELDVGDSFTAPVIGVVDYAFGHFTLIAENVPSGLRLSPVVSRGELASPGPRDLTLATFNVQNLGPRSAAAKFEGIAGQIVRDLAAPDVVVLEEIQDNSGAADDGTTDASRTYRTLVDAIGALGGPVYLFRDAAPYDAEDGGEPGANIRVGFLVREDRGLAVVDRVASASTGPTAVRSVAGRVELDRSPGRLDPSNPAFAHSRKPVAIELAFQGLPIFVIGLHFTSQLGDRPLFGRFQPADRPTRVQRTAEARVVGSFIRRLLDLDPKARVIVAGDMNDAPWSPPLDVLRDAGLRDVTEAAPAGERYTHVFEGNADALDHVLASRALADDVTALAIAHANADFARAVSDHDPVAVRFAVREDKGRDEAAGCRLSHVAFRVGSAWWGLPCVLWLARRRAQRATGRCRCARQFLSGAGFSGKDLAP